MHSIRWKILRPILDAGMSFVQKDTGLSWTERSQRTDEPEDRPCVAILHFADNLPAGATTQRRYRRFLRGYDILVRQMLHPTEWPFGIFGSSGYWGPS